MQIIERSEELPDPVEPVFLNWEGEEKEFVVLGCHKASIVGPKHQQPDNITQSFRITFSSYSCQCTLYSGSGEEFPDLKEGDTIQLLKEVDRNCPGLYARNMNKEAANLANLVIFD